MTSPSVQEVVAVLGHPVGGNPAQFLLEKAFAHEGLDWRCLTLDVPATSLADALRGVRAMGFRGCRLAYPEAVDAAEHVDRSSEIAQLIGSIDCLGREGDELVGGHSFSESVLRAARAHGDVREAQILALGSPERLLPMLAAMALAEPGPMILAGPVTHTTNELANRISERTGRKVETVTWVKQLLVPEGTRIVLHDGTLESDRLLDAQSLPTDAIVVDLTPGNSFLRREAAARGCVVIDEMTRIVHDVAASFASWTGVEPDLTVLRESLEEYWAL